MYKMSLRQVRKTKPLRVYAFIQNTIMLLSALPRRSGYSWESFAAFNICEKMLLCLTESKCIIKSLETLTRLKSKTKYLMLDLIVLFFYRAEILLNPEKNKSSVHAAGILRLKCFNKNHIYESDCVLYRLSENSSICEAGSEFPSEK